jgi:hypothetical protein
VQTIYVLICRYKHTFLSYIFANADCISTISIEICHLVATHPLDNVHHRLSNGVVRICTHDCNIDFDRLSIDHRQLIIIGIFAFGLCICCVVRLSDNNDNDSRSQLINSSKLWTTPKKSLPLYQQFESKSDFIYW